MATNIVVNTNIGVNTDSESNEVQLMNELLGMSADQMCDHISSLILSCESKKDDLLFVKRQLEAYHRDAIKHNNKYKHDKLWWTGVKCAAMACGGVAVFIPGVGWITGSTILAANYGVMYGDYKCDKQYKKEVSEIINKIDDKAIKVLPIAQKVVNTKEEFDKQRIRLIGQGYHPDHASIALIMAMLTGQFRPVQEINITLPEPHNLMGNTSMPLFISKKAQEQMAEWAAKLANKAGQGFNISPKFIGGFCAAIAVAGIAYDIYTYAKVCLDTSKAVDKAEELIEVMDKGLTSTEYFINLLKHVSDNISRHNFRKQLGDISAQLDNQKQYFEDRLNQLSDLLKESGIDVIGEMKNEFNSLRDQQGVFMNSLVHVLNNMNRSISDRNRQTDAIGDYEVINSLPSIDSIP